MTAFAKKLGTNYIVARNANTYASPTWNAGANLRDIKLALNPYKFDSSNRVGSVNTVITVRFKPELTFNAQWDGGTFLTALRTAFLGGTSIELLAVDGASTGRGLRGEWCVTEFPIKFPLRDGQALDIKCQPHGNYTNAMIFASAMTVSATDSVSTIKLGTNATVNDSGGTPQTFWQDVSFSIKPAGLFDSADRNTLFDTVVPTRFEYGFEGSFLWDVTIAELLLFWTNIQANPPTPTELFVLDGPYATTGSWGIHSTWNTTDYEHAAPLIDGQKVTVKFEPAGNGSVAPVLFTAP